MKLLSLNFPIRKFDDPKKNIGAYTRDARICEGHARSPGLLPS